MTPIRVLVADDQALLRASFRILLDSEPDLVTVGEAGTGSQAVTLARQEKPDVILMDIRMPMEGLLAALKARSIEMSDPPRFVPPPARRRGSTLFHPQAAGAERPGMPGVRDASHRP
jgi:chemotaxis response regulator CheB